MSPIELTPEERETLPWAKQQQLIEERKRAWLESLKVGDEFAHSRFGTIDINTIARMTTTQFVTNNGARFRRADGVKIGGGSHFWTIEPVTDDIRAKIKARENRREFENIAWRARHENLEDEEIAVMLDALNAHRAKSKENGHA